MEATTPEWIQAVAAVLAVVGAIVVGWRQIGVSQRQTALQEFQLRESLFDRRVEVFEDVQSLFSEVLREGKPAGHESTRQFIRAKQRARFLFSRSVNEYLDSVWAHHCDLSMHQSMQKGDYGDDGDKSVETIKAYHQELKWFANEGANLVVRFGELKPLG